MMIHTKCPKCQQAVSVNAQQKFEAIMPADALSSLELSFQPEGRVDLENLCRLFTQKAAIRLDTSGFMDEQGRLHLKIVPVALNAKELAKNMPGAQAAAKVASLMSSTRDQLIEKCVELGIEFYPKANEEELRRLIEGEMAKQKKEPERAPRGKPEPVLVK